MGSTMFRAVCFHLSNTHSLLHLRWENLEEQIYDLFVFFLMVVAEHHCPVNERQHLYQFVCPRNFLICPSGYQEISVMTVFPVQNEFCPFSFPRYIHNLPYERRRI